VDIATTSQALPTTWLSLLSWLSSMNLGPYFTEPRTPGFQGTDLPLQVIKVEKKKIQGADMGDTSDALLSVIR
jgi:hypothetical protein